MLHLLERVDVDHRDAPVEREPQLLLGLRVAVEDDPVGRAAGAEDQLQVAERDGVDERALLRARPR